MDDDPGADQQDEKAIIYRGARYELTLGPLGHEIWDLDAPEGAAPVAMYPVTDEGFEALRATPRRDGARVRGAGRDRRDA